MLRLCTELPEHRSESLRLQCTTNEFIFHFSSFLIYRRSKLDGFYCMYKFHPSTNEKYAIVVFSSFYCFYVMNRDLSKTCKILKKLTEWFRFPHPSREGGVQPHDGTDPVPQRGAGRVALRLCDPKT